MHYQIKKGAGQAKREKNEHDQITERQSETNKSRGKKFEKGDTIWGANQDPEELKRWTIDQEDEARSELARYNCEYDDQRELLYIVEYALEFYRADEDGEFLEGSNFDLAAERLN